MPIEQFQAACAAEGVRVGRPFPPLWTRCRISLGTMDEMQRAATRIATVLDSAPEDGGVNLARENSAVGQATPASPPRGGLQTGIARRAKRELLPPG